MTTDSMDAKFYQELQEALRQVTAREIGPISADAPIADLGLDSVSLAELIVVIEDTYDVTLEQKDIECLRSFGDLHQLVTQVRAGRATGQNA